MVGRDAPGSTPQGRPPVGGPRRPGPLYRRGHFGYSNCGVYSRTTLVLAWADYRRGKIRNNRTILEKLIWRENTIYGMETIAPIALLLGGGELKRGIGYLSHRQLDRGKSRD